MRCFLFLIVFFSDYAFSEDAKESWLCTDAASVRNGAFIKVCGVATGQTEEIAREKALANAKQEFIEICSDSADCKGFDYTMEPLRMSCNKLESGDFKCYRGLEYTISEKKNDSILLEEILALKENEKETSAREYELTKEISERQKEIDELKRKTKERDFEEKKPESEKNEPSWLSRNLFNIGDYGYPFPSRWNLGLTMSGLSGFSNFGGGASAGASLEFRLLRRVGLKAQYQLLAEVSEDSDFKQSGRLFTFSTPIYLRDSFFIEPSFEKATTGNPSTTKATGFGAAIGYLYRTNQNSGTGLSIRGGVKRFSDAQLNESKTPVYVSFDFLIWL